MKLTRLFHLGITCAAMLSLSACGTLGDMFSDKKPPLPGERLPFLQLQKELAPNPALADTPPQLPEAWTNQLWPQAGGYPTHAMGHLALGDALKRDWTASVGAGGSVRRPLTARPVVADGTVFTLDAEHEISAFDLASGKRKWRAPTVPEDDADSGALGGGIAYASGMLYVSNGHKNIVALDTAAGKQVWRADLPAPARGAPTVMDGRVYQVTLDNRLMVFSAADGAPLWKYSGISETTNLLGTASPAVDQTVVILPLSSGEIVALQPATGQPVWQDNLSSVRRSGPMTMISDIRALPVIDQGLVYAVSYSGRMIASDAATGQRLWQREIGSGETPWVAGDSIFLVTADQMLVALTRQGGEIRWVSPLERADGGDNIVWAGPVLAGGRLFAAGSNGTMVEADPASGKILKKHKLPGGAVLPPVVSGNTLLVLTENGTLAAYR